MAELSDACASLSHRSIVKSQLNELDAYRLAAICPETHGGLSSFCSVLQFLLMCSENLDRIEKKTCEPCSHTLTVLNPSNPKLPKGSPRPKFAPPLQACLETPEKGLVAELAVQVTPMQARWVIWTQSR